MLVLDSITIKYDEKCVIENLSHTFESSKIHVILGKSGSGKSSLIRCIANLMVPYSGCIDGNTSTSILFQDGNLFEWLTVLDNVALPLYNEGFDKEQSLTRARELINRVGLSNRETAYPNQLSGGEKQRISLARSLACSRDLLLLDEATSSLDFETSLSMLNLISSIQNSENTSIIYVTHKIEEALMIGDSISILHNGIFKMSIPNKKTDYGSDDYWVNLKILTELFNEAINL